MTKIDTKMAKTTIFSPNLHRFDIYNTHFDQLEGEFQFITSTVGFIITAKGKNLSFYPSLRALKGPVDPADSVGGPGGGPIRGPETKKYSHECDIIGLSQLTPCSVAVIDKRNYVFEYFGDGSHKNLLKSNDEYG